MGMTESMFLERSYMKFRISQVLRLLSASRAVNSSLVGRVVKLSIVWSSLLGGK